MPKFPKGSELEDDFDLNSTDTKSLVRSTDLNGTLAGSAVQDSVDMLSLAIAES